MVFKQCLPFYKNFAVVSTCITSRMINVSYYSHILYGDSIEITMIYNSVVACLSQIWKLTDTWHGSAGFFPVVNELQASQGSDN